MLSIYIAPAVYDRDGGMLRRSARLRRVGQGLAAAASGTAGAGARRSRAPDARRAAARRRSARRHDVDDLLAAAASVGIDAARRERDAGRAMILGHDASRSFPDSPRTGFGRGRPRSAASSAVTARRCCCCTAIRRRMRCGIAWRPRLRASTRSSAPTCGATAIPASPHRTRRTRLIRSARSRRTWSS